MGSPLDIIKSKIAVHLTKKFPTVSVDSVIELLEEPKKKEHGDLTLPCPRLKLGQPMEICNQLNQFYTAEPIENVTTHTSGPFLNFKINPKWYTSCIFNHILQTPTFGKTDIGSGKTCIVEFSSPNIAKPFHAGHMRGTIIGNILSNILLNHNFKVVRMNYLGDWGKQFGLLAIGFKKYGSEKDLKENPIQHLFEVYVKINKDATSDESIHEEARQYFKKMEEGDEAALELWSRFRETSIEMYIKMYERLNVKFDVFSGESFYNLSKMAEVEKLILPLCKDDKGAKLLEFESAKLSTVVFRKSDGTTTYLARDVAAAIDRFEKYKFDKMYYLIASQQDLHCRQLFQILKDLKLPFADRCEHISFGLIQGMSTRKGDVVFLSDILDAVQEETLSVMKKNEHKFKDITDPKQIADQVGLSAIIVQDLSARRILNYTFNWDRMLSFEGSTGPYLQYTHARLCSLQRHFDFKIPEKIDVNLDFTTLDEGVIDLAKHLIKFPDVLVRLVSVFEPVGLIRYVMELSQMTSSLLAKLIVRDAKEEEKLKMLVVFSCAKNILNKGMVLIGLTPVERM
eukprot:NODE_1075_length_2323_cov_0.619604.p1 type:complete len:569 gc:universal NODE_1075_length_2323_cov_0.619604:1997-291(-)